VAEETGFRLPVLANFFVFCLDSIFLREHVCWGLPEKGVLWFLWDLGLDFGVST
jgi:hypothetical protein